MKKIMLKPNDILDKQFNIDIKGYSITEVDRYMDEILNDYYTMIELENDYAHIIKTQEDEIDELKMKIKEISTLGEVNEAKYRKLEDGITSNMDVLKRLASLEDKFFSTQILNIQKESEE